MKKRAGRPVSDALRHFHSQAIAKILFEPAVDGRKFKV
jgi:hypothetical protein